ncbi:MAG: MBOAT family protein [Lachnospiraceae bacterium]|nr:MBOAT family protein [Lachnospiraceae bacterium]
MVFSSTIFLFVFLPITLLFYYISKEQYKNYVLLAASLIFYAYGEPRLVFLMMLSVVFNYFLALGIEQYPIKRLLLIIGVFYNLGVLFLFKYMGFTISVLGQLFHIKLSFFDIALPIGISFYTFQSISYIIDVYNEKSKAQRNLLDLGLYIALFPQLIAGPIVRYNSVAEQINSRVLSPELFGAGVKRFILGFCKKVLLANNLALAAQHYFESSGRENSIAGVWIGAICYSLQIFYDFSGYSDMAIGLGKMFGFIFEENFNYPYISKSITEFWRRWHISLGRWFRDYVYIPLGGSRVSVPRHILNMAIVWILTGIWHGASYSFIVWGIWYFAALIFEKYIIQPEKRKKRCFHFLYRIIVLIYINFGWVIFNADSLRKGIDYCLAMIGIGCETAVWNMQDVSILREYGFFILAALLFSTPVAPVLSKRIGMNYKFLDKMILPCIYIVGFLWAISFLVLGAHNPFIYFNF